MYIRLRFCFLSVLRGENKYVRFGACYLYVHSRYCCRIWIVLEFIVFGLIGENYCGMALFYCC